MNDVDRLMRPGSFHEIPLLDERDVPVVAMTEHMGKLYVATSKGVYVLTDGGFERLIFVEPNEGMFHQVNS